MFDCILKVLYNAIDCCSTQQGGGQHNHRNGINSGNNGNGNTGNNNNNFSTRDAQYNTFECGFALCDIGFMLIAIIPIIFFYYSILSSIVIYIRIKKYENKCIVLLSSLLRIRDDNNNDDSRENNTNSNTITYPGRCDFRIDTNRRRAGGGRF